MREFSAKGGHFSENFTFADKYSHYSGSNTAATVAWFIDNSGSRTREVGRLASNELGIYDMSGNVWDLWGDYTADPKTDPTGASSGSDCVMRGGCFINVATDLRSVHRGFTTPGTQNGAIGFRVVRP